MWLPSLLSVLHDLWLFCTGRAPATEVSSCAPVKHNFEHEIIVTKVAKKVRLRDGITYTADRLETIQIRNRLSAYDSNITTSNVLTEYEWLLYNMQEKRLAVPLLALRLTPLGRWHTTMKGQPGINIGITPYTDALMEWSTDEDGRIGWIHEVSPDETITIGELGRIKSGLYVIRSLPRSKWLELRPVFISFD